MIREFWRRLFGAAPPSSAGGEPEKEAPLAEHGAQRVSTASATAAKEPAEPRRWTDAAGRTPTT
jgi:hypothetical protein